MTANDKHSMIKLALAGGAAFLGYEFVYKPWKAAKDAAALALTTNTAAGGGGFLNYTPTAAGGNYFAPSQVPANPNTGPLPSVLRPGDAVGGLIGYCMNKKGWTQQQCQARYDNLMKATQMAQTDYPALVSGATAAAIQGSITAINSQIAALGPQYNQAVATGDLATANQLKVRIDALNSQIAAAQSQIASIAGKIAQYKSDMANWQAQYLQIFGGQLPLPA